MSPHLRAVEPSVESAERLPSVRRAADFFAREADWILQQQIRVTSIPARVFIAFYALGDMYLAYKGYGTNYDHIGVTHHVAGFLFGLAAAWPLRQYGLGDLEQPRVIKAYRKTIRQVWEEHDHWGEGR